jgi:hypothetical protein
MLWHDQKNQRKVETEKDRKTRPPTDRAFSRFENNWRKVSKVALILDGFDLEDISLLRKCGWGLAALFQGEVY